MDFIYSREIYKEGNRHKKSVIAKKILSKKISIKFVAFLKGHWAARIMLQYRTSANRFLP